jgi:ankyrin
VTPLHVASHYDHQNVALLLLDKGASPHATAKNGHTPLHIAARKNQMDIATTLLEYGAKANAESRAGFTPLHLSAQEGHTDMSTLLIEHQADTNHQAKVLEMFPSAINFVFSFIQFLTCYAALLTEWPHSASFMCSRR